MRIPGMKGVLQAAGAAAAWAAVVGCGARPIEGVGARGRVPAAAPAPRTPACRFEAAVSGAPRPVLAVGAGHELVFLRSDGSTSVAHRFGAGEGDTVGFQGAVARGGYLAASAQVSNAGDPYRPRLEVALLDRGGQVLWSDGDALPYGGLFLNPRGMVVMRGGEAQGLFVQPDGTRFDLGEWVPLAEPLADGRVPVCRQAAYRCTFEGWWRPGAWAIEPLAVPAAADWTWPVRAGDGLVYLGRDGEAAVLVNERADARRVLRLPAEMRADELQIAATGESGFVLLARWDGEGRAFLRADLGSGEMAEVARALPEGLRRFSGDYDGPQLDEDGALLEGLRDDFAGALYRSADLGRSWTRVSATVSDVLAIGGSGRGGSYLVFATSERYASEEWPEAPADRAPELRGDGVQVVRPADGARHVLASPRGLFEQTSLASLSADGLCLAYWQQAGDGVRLKVLDVQRGATLDLLGAEQAGGAPVWIEP